MDEKQLKEKLEELHAEIEHAGPIDEKGMELLRDLSAHINELLERSGGKPIEAQTSTIQHLENNIAHFEVSHPTITLALSNLLNTLSGSGI